MKISVIIPVYCVEKHIARCLESVLSQTHSDFEVIIVNDATPDRSMDVVAKYAARDSRIVVIENERNRGLMVVRKIGYLRATGRYVFFADSDDFMPPNALELLVRAAEANGADLVCGQHDRVREDGSHDSVSHYRLSHGRDVTGIYRSMLRMEFPDTVWGKLYSRELFNREYVAIENLTEAEDTVLSFLVSGNVRNAAVIDDVVYHYCENNASSTHCKTLANTESRIKGLKYVEELLTGHQELKTDFIVFAGIVLHTYYRHGAKDKAAVRELLKKYDMHCYVRPAWLRRNLPSAAFKTVMVRCLRISLIRWSPKIVIKYLRKIFRRP